MRCHVKEAVKCEPQNLNTFLLFPKETKLVQDCCLFLVSLPEPNTCLPSFDFFEALGQFKKEVLKTRNCGKVYKTSWPETKQDMIPLMREKPVVIPSLDV